MTNEEMNELGISPSAYRFESHPSIRVEWRGPASWAIVDYGIVLNKDNQWEHEPSPSNRSDDFIERTRYPLNEALRRALKAIEENNT